nr:hypothetical protein [Tanacetum cinerariifolium]
MAQQPEQQAVTFQEQFEALRAELHASMRSMFVDYPQGALSKLLQLGTVKEYQVSKHTTLDMFSLARIIEARFDDQAALVAGTLVGLEANKVVSGDDLESSRLVTPTNDSESPNVAKVLNWVQQSIDVESAYDNDAQDKVSELEMKALVDGK